MTMWLTLLLAALPQSQPQAPAGWSDVLPLGALVHADPPALLVPWGSLLHRGGTTDADLVTTTNDRRITAELLTRQLGPLHDLRLGATADDSHVRATGEPAAIESLRGFLVDAEAMLAGEVHIEVALWDATDRPPPPVRLDAAQWRTFAERQQPLARVRTTGRVGRPTSLQRLRESTYVQRVVGEVAQGQSVIAPGIDAYSEGVAATLVTHTLVGSNDLVVFAQVALGQRRGVVRTLATGITGAPDIDVPTLESCNIACSGRVPDGGALAITLRGDASTGGQHILTIRPALGTARPTIGRSGAALLPIGALTSSAMTTGCEPPSPRGTNWSPPARSKRRATLWTFDELLNELRRVAPDAKVAPFGDAVILIGDDTRVAMARRWLADLEDRHLSTLAVEATGRLQDLEGADASARMLHELHLPTLPDRTFVVHRMLETTVVAGLAPRIAQEAATLEPEIGILQSGTWFGGHVAAGPRGLALEASIQCAHAPTPIARTVMPGGALTPTETTITRLHTSGVFGDQQPIDHGDGPTILVDGRAFRTNLSTTVRADSRR
jgi:hypothetical protein